MLRRFGLCLMLALPAMAGAGEIPALCYREDAAPFSYVTEAGAPTGYSVGLCRHVLDKMGVADPEMVLVTAENRFDKLRGGECDVLCEATTVTMQRRAEIEFSLITFLTGTVFLFPKDLLDDGYVSDRKIAVGVLSKTTAFDRWKSGDLAAGEGIDFVFQEHKSHEDAEAALQNGELQAYIADREIVEQFLRDNPDLAKTHVIGAEALSYEPYALGVRMGDDALRIKIDEALAALYRSGDIFELIDEYLPNRRNDRLLEGLFDLQSLPE